jgi:putative tricarboxylic transport membrane protein
MTKERFGSLFLLLLGAYALIHSLRLPLGNWNQPGPGVFPLILSLLLSAIGVALLVSSKGGNTFNWKDSLSRQKSTWAIMGLTAGFILGFGRLGFVLTSGLYLFLLFYWICRFRLRIAAPLAAGITAAGWYLFVKILNLQFPPALWRL